MAFSFGGFGGGLHGRSPLGMLLSPYGLLGGLMRRGRGGGFGRGWGGFGGGLGGFGGVRLMQGMLALNLLQTVVALPRWPPLTLGLVLANVASHLAKGRVSCGRFRVISAHIHFGTRSTICTIIAVMEPVTMEVGT